MTRAPLDAAETLRRRFDSVPRAQAVRAALSVVRVALDYVVHDRAAFEHGLDVVGWWCDGQCDRAGLVAARRTLAESASRAHLDDDRAAWLATEAVVALFDCALEEHLVEVSARHAWRAVASVREAGAWPDLDDAEALATVDAALRARLDAALPPVSGGP